MNYYRICSLSNISDQPKQTTTLNVTQINELTTNNNENKYFSYVDESKREHRCCYVDKGLGYCLMEKSTYYWKKPGKAQVGAPLKAQMAVLGKNSGKIFSYRPKKYCAEMMKGGHFWDHKKKLSQRRKNVKGTPGIERTTSCFVAKVTNLWATILP